MRIISIIICIFLMSGCSLVWHNRNYPEQSQQCPVEHWPYIVDAVSTIAFLTLAVSLQTGLIKTADESEPTYAYLPFFMISAAFGTSAVAGGGEVINCQRQMAQE